MSVYDSGIFPTSTPEAQGIDSQGILNLLDAMEKDGRPFHSLLIMRHGTMVAEHYFHPYDRHMKHSMYSVSKSFTSTVIGMCVTDGLLTVEDDVLSFFPEYAPAEPCENLKLMKVKHLLTMSTGQKEEPSVWEHANWVKAFLEAPVEYEPGTVFHYNSIATHMLAAIVKKLTGKNVHDILKERVFNRLGITGTEFSQDPQGIDCGGWGLRITPRDMMRFGYLYLNEGNWGGEQIVPVEWVREATRRHTCRQGPKEDINWVSGYGYQFWRCTFDAYRADGAYGQFIVVVPKSDMVVVITSALIGSLAEPLHFIEDHLLPKLSDSPLAENRIKYDLLMKRFDALNRPVTQYGPYTLKKNALDIKQIGFNFEAGASVYIKGKNGTDRVPCSLNRNYAISDCRIFGEMANQVAARGAWHGDKFHFELHAIGTQAYLFGIAAFGDEKISLEFDGVGVVYGIDSKFTVEGRI